MERKAVSEMPIDPEACQAWARRVLEVQRRRNPAEWEAARQRIESARERERQSRKCKAVKSHAIRSRALAAEGLRQMSVAPASEHLAVQTRWASAQEASAKFASARWEEVEREEQGPVDEDEAMEEAAGLMGQEVSELAALGNDGLEEGAKEARSIDEILAQLRKEPANEDECAAKFMLYDARRRFCMVLSSEKAVKHGETGLIGPKCRHAASGRLRPRSRGGARHAAEVQRRDGTVAAERCGLGPGAAGEAHRQYGGNGHPG